MEMDIFEALFTRRSIRKYTQEDVSDEDLNILLKAAMLAPSASNRQPCTLWWCVIPRCARPWRDGIPMPKWPPTRRW